MAEVVGSAAVVSRLTLLLMFCINSDKLILSAMIVQTVCSVIFKRPNFYQTIITTTEFVPVTLYFRQYAYVQQRICAYKLPSICLCLHAGPKHAK